MAPNRPIFFAVRMDVSHLELKDVSYKPQLEPPTPLGSRSVRVVTEHRDGIIFVPLPGHVHHARALMPRIHPADRYRPATLASRDQEYTVLNCILVAPAIFNLGKRTPRTYLNVQG